MIWEREIEVIAMLCDEDSSAEQSPSNCFLYWPERPSEPQVYLERFNLRYRLTNIGLGFWRFASNGGSRSGAGPYHDSAHVFRAQFVNANHPHNLPLSIYCMAGLWKPGRQFFR
jgi:hypothetical protein